MAKVGSCAFGTKPWNEGNLWWRVLLGGAEPTSRDWCRLVLLRLRGFARVPGTLSCIIVHFISPLVDGREEVVRVGCVEACRDVLPDIVAFCLSTASKHGKGKFDHHLVFCLV